MASTCELTFAGCEWTRGNCLCSVAFGPTNRFLHCRNQRAGHVTVFRTGAKTGWLVFTGQYAPAGNPSSIVLVDLANAG